MSATLQGRREIPEDVMPFHAASNLPVEELKCEAMKNLQKALIGKDVGKAVVLLGAARSVCPEGDALGAKDSEDEEDFMATTIYCSLIWASRRNQWRRRKVGEEKDLGDNSKSTNHPIIHIVSMFCSKRQFSESFQQFWRDLATNTKDSSLRELVIY